MSDSTVHQARTVDVGAALATQHLVLRDTNGALSLTIVEDSKLCGERLATIYLSPAQLAELCLAAATLVSKYASEESAHDDEHWLNEHVLAWQEKNRKEAEKKS